MIMESRIYNTNLVVNIVVIVSVLLIIIVIRRFIGILPAAVRGIFKWKENISLEYSVRLSRDRNVVFSAMILPFCLLTNRYALSFPSFLAGIHPALHLLASCLIFLVYLWLRDLMKSLCKRPGMDSLAYTAAFNFFRTVFCVAVPVCLASAGIMSVANVPVDVAQVVILDEIALFYLLLLWREGEILSHYCTVLATILYLCGLEILPAAVPVVLYIV